MQIRAPPATISKRLTVLWSPFEMTVLRAPFKLTALRPPKVAWTRLSCMASSDRKALRAEVHVFDSKLSGDGQPRQTPTAHGSRERISQRPPRCPGERHIPAPAWAAVRSIPVGAAQ